MKGNLINNFISLKCTIPVSGGHCYCSHRTSINPATSLKFPRNPVNINTHKTLAMPQQLHFTPDQLLQLYRAKYLLCIPSAVTSMQSALSIPTAPYIMYQQHNATAELCKLLYVLSGGCFVALNHTKRTAAYPGFLSVGGRGIFRVIQHTLSMINISQMSHLVSWWKQRGGGGGATHAVP
jgi:hypothetical protein